ncbi:hypothetical protein BJV82DRAFT_615712 [Fennellomyces sp. T-0311]|nr:hypothetical protein BJV82DRAFT_615712 [Fennellomyces sp. T-0311]
MSVGNVSGSVTCWAVDFAISPLLAYTERVSHKSETLTVFLPCRVYAENNSAPSKIVPQPPSNCSLRLNVTALNAVCPLLYHSRRISHLGL